jgi:hypothetical protein
MAGRLFLGKADRSRLFQTIVVIRFSYLAEAGFKLAEDGIDAARATLYDPDRLARRIALFEALTLPSLLAQTEKHFTTILLIGADFPANARAKLVALLAPLQDAHVVALPPMNNYKSTRQAMRSVLRPDAPRVLSVRLDDDDAISTDTIAELHRLAPLAAQMSGKDDPVVLAFNHGLFLTLSPSGNGVFAVTEKLPLGIGMAMLAPRDARQTIFSADHRLVHTRFNVYTDGTVPRYIRTVHADNDSTGYVTGRRHDLDDEALQAILRRHFPFSLAQLRAIDLNAPMLGC